MNATETRRGTVKWFDFSKKYGFVTLEGDEDAMLHISCLQQSRITDVPKGSAVEVIVERTKKGLSIRRVISLTPAKEEPYLNGNAYVAATVKWFDAGRGYGFVSRGDGTPDVFIHVVTVKQSGLVELKPDQQVMVVIEDGKNGPKVAHIKAVA